MYNYASKILSFFLDPTSVLVLLAVAALLSWRSRRLSFALVLSLTLILVTFSSQAVANWLLHTLEDQYPDKGIEAVPPAQAIVVLGGSLRMPAGDHRASGFDQGGDRLLVAFRLYRAGKAPLVVCSGGNNPLSSSAKHPESEGMCDLLREWGVPADALLTERKSINTRENAVESRALLAERGIERIVLVTSATHMPRAVATFEKVGFEVAPAPADFRVGWGDPHPLLEWAPTSLSLLGASMVLHEWVGLWIYRLRGWA